MCFFVAGRAGAGAGPLWLPAQAPASSCFSTVPRWSLGRLLSCSSPSPLSTVFVGSDAGGVGEGQSGDWGVEALRELGTLGADCGRWVLACVCVCVCACARAHVGGGAEVRSAGKGVRFAGFSVSSPT